MEPVIGHLKSDGRLARNFLKYVKGDAMNAPLCGAGHNLRKILRKLRFFYASLGLPLPSTPSAMIAFMRRPKLSDGKTGFLRDDLLICIKSFKFNFSNHMVNSS